MAGPLSRRLCFDQCALVKALDVVAPSKDGIDGHDLASHLENALIAVATQTDSELRNFGDALLVQGGNDATVTSFDQGGDILGDDLKSILPAATVKNVVPFFAAANLNSAFDEVTTVVTLGVFGKRVHPLVGPFHLGLKHLGVDGGEGFVDLVLHFNLRGYLNVLTS